MSVHTVELGHPLGPNMIRSSAAYSGGSAFHREIRKIVVAKALRTLSMQQGMALRPAQTS